MEKRSDENIRCTECGAVLEDGLCVSCKKTLNKEAAHKISIADCEELWAPKTEAKNAGVSV